MTDRTDIAAEERASDERARRFLEGEGGSGDPPVGLRSGRETEAPASPDALGRSEGGVPTGEDFGLRTPTRQPKPGARHDPEHPSE
jgi:hypothetical protein